MEEENTENPSRRKKMLRALAEYVIEVFGDRKNATADDLDRALMVASLLLKL